MVQGGYLNSEAGGVLIDGWEMDFGVVPTILYCGLVTLTIYPFSFIRPEKLKTVNNVHRHIIFAFTLLIIIQGLIVYYLVGGSIFDIMNGDFNDLKNAGYEGDITPADAKMLTMPFPIQVLYFFSFMTLLGIPLFFYYTCVENHSLWITAPLLAVSISPVLRGMLAADRTEIIHYGLMFLFTLVFFRGLITKTMKRFLIIFSVPVLLVGATYVVAVSAARFETSDEGAQGSMLEYTGQSYINFCYFYDNHDRSLFYLEREFPITSLALFKSQYVDTKDERTAREGFWVGVFASHVGSWFIDTGEFGAIIISVLFALFCCLVIKRYNRTEFDIADILMLFALGAVPTFGIFYYRYYSFQTAVVSATAVVLYLLSKFVFVWTKSNEKNSECQKRMKYYFPIHFDGGNRGCEGIARSSAYLLNKKQDQIFGYCRNIELDTRLGLDQCLTLVPCKHNSYLIDRFLAAINKLFHTTTTKKWRLLYHYRSFLRMVSKDDVVVFTGGDMMCYDNNEVIFINNWLHKRGIKTILWGCSMGPENQTKEKLETLNNFSLIYVRESLSFDYFNSLGHKNICLFPDPAFILEPEECELPACFANHGVIGLNISNYVAGGMTLDSKFGEEEKQLISYILNETNDQILLIPHVTWKDSLVNQDDREMAQLISQHFNNTERIHVLDIDGLNYCQIRYVISKCSMFIGARTHAVISAYSTCVPTIALGYSIKSRGIAKDLGLDEQLVVNSKDFKEGDLLLSFEYLMQNESLIREHLKSIMPEYRQRPYQMREILCRNHL